MIENFGFRWGITLSMADVEDLFIEEFVDETHYKGANGEIKEAKVREETILTKSGKSISHKVLTTDHGVIIDDVLNFKSSEFVQPSIHFFHFPFPQMNVFLKKKKV